MQDRHTVTVAGLDATLSSPAVSAGGLIFVSAMGPSVPAPAGIEAQTRQALDRLRGVLEAAGSSLAQAVSVHVYLRDPADFDAMNAVYRDAFTDKPPSRTTVAVDLPTGVRIMLAAIAVPLGAPREVLFPAGWAKSPRPYSPIVRAGGFVFLSGQVSRRGVDDQLVPGSVALQTTTILNNAAVLLKTAGVSLADVVSARVYLTDDSFFEAMNDEYRGYFTTEPPARATAVTGLMNHETAVEITLVASESGKQVIGPAVAPSLPLSTAVRAGDFLFLSGVLGTTDTNADDTPGQTREAIARIHRTLDGVGLSFMHVVENLVYLSDLWQQPAFDSAMRGVFASDPPARTVVGAKLATRAGLVEMMMTATAR